MTSIEIAAIKMGANPELALMIENAFIHEEIVSGLEKAHLLAQMSVESAGFSRLRENLNYSVVGLLKTFPRHRINETGARMYGRTAGQPANQEAIANLVYGDRLGNHKHGDGWKFIGRGVKQITGRGNYTRYSQDTYGDDRCVVDPTMLERLPDAVISAMWYWKKNSCGKYAVADDVLAVSRIVNLGNPRATGTPNGMQDRIRATNKCKLLFLGKT